MRTASAPSSDLVLTSTPPLTIHKLISPRPHITFPTTKFETTSVQYMMTPDGMLKAYAAGRAPTIKSKAKSPNTVDNTRVPSPG